MVGSTRVIAFGVVMAVMALQGGQTVRAQDFNLVPLAESPANFAEILSGSLNDNGDVAFAVREEKDGPGVIYLSLPASWFVPQLLTATTDSATDPAINNDQVVVYIGAGPDPVGIYRIGSEKPLVVPGTGFVGALSIGSPTGGGGAGGAGGLDIAYYTFSFDIDTLTGTHAVNILVETEPESIECTDTFSESVLGPAINDNGNMAYLRSTLLTKGDFDSRIELMFYDGTPVENCLDSPSVTLATVRSHSGTVFDCCTANSGQGCADPECEAAVCAILPACCETVWDAACADQALTECPSLCAVIVGALSNPSINASDVIAVFARSDEDSPNDLVPGIYTIDPDDDPPELTLRVELTGDSTPPPAENTQPFINDDGHLAFTARTAGGGGGGCNDCTAIGEGSFNGVNSDTETDITSCTFSDTMTEWYCYTASCSGTATATTCGSGFDTALSAWDACGGSQLACNDDFCGLQSTIDWAVSAGVTYFIRVSGFNNASGSFTLDVSCEGGGGGGGCGNCNVPHDGLGCSDPVCEALVCGADSFCCSVGWDQICADSAELLCDCGGADGSTLTPAENTQPFINDDGHLAFTARTPGGSSNCCAPNGKGDSGCDDPDCQALICGILPFCCTDPWDGKCAAEAAELCSSLCTVPGVFFAEPPNYVPFPVIVAGVGFGEDFESLEVFGINNNDDILIRLGRLEEDVADPDNFVLVLALVLARREMEFDLNGDGVIGIQDFLVLLGQWGSDPGGPPDFDRDGTVGITDLLALFSNWS